MKLVMALLVLVIAGCGGGSTSTQAPTQTQAALVSGPWSATAVSSSGNGTGLVFANIQAQGSGQFFSTASATLLCKSGDASCFGLLPQESSLGPTYSLTETTSNGNQVTGSITVTDVQIIPNQSIGTISYTGTLSADGKSINGTYSLTGTDGYITGPDSGSWTAQAVSLSSLSGNYSGSVTSEVNGQTFPVSANITVNSDFSIAGSGMVSNSACLSTITFGQGPNESSYSIGSAFQLASTNGSVVIDAIPNGSSYALFYNLQTQTCGDTGTGTATK